MDFPGPWYHVLNPGNRKTNDLPDQALLREIHRAIEQLARTIRSTAPRLCLDGEPLPFAVGKPRGKPHQAMHWLNVSYSVWLNRKYNRVGPLFQGRFKAILHETTEALMINRYIHLNPVRIAALGGHENRGIASQDISEDLARRRVDALEQYCWSSYAFFAGRRPAPEWLCTETILAFLGNCSQRELQEAFRRELQEAAAAGSWETDWKAKVRYTILLGSSEFVARMRKLLRGDRDQQTGVRQGAVKRVAWTQIVQAVSAVWDRPWKELLCARGSGARETALFFGRHYGRLNLKELGQLAGGIHHNAVSIAIRRLTERLKSDSTLLAKFSLVQKALELC